MRMRMRNFAKVCRFQHSYADLDADFCISLYYFALFHMFLSLYPHIFAFFADFHADFSIRMQILMQISALNCGSKL